MENSKTVLIVDDDIELRVILRDVLSAEGIQVQTAGNGKEALDLLARIDNPDMILTDLMMPVMDGYEFIKILRSNLAWNSIPVVVISGDIKSSHIEGISAFIEKPFTFHLIFEFVRNCLHNNRSFV